MDLEQVTQYVFHGVTVGSVYALVAIGFNIIYNTTGIINFAQGEFVIVGAMIAISLATVLPVPAAIVLAILATALLGGLIERIFIRPVREASVLRLIVVTIGLSILLREAMLHVWGNRERFLPPFSGTETTSYPFLGAHVTPQTLWILGSLAVIVAGLTLFFRFTMTGRAMRACCDDRMAARLCGINDRRMVTLTFMLSAGLGAAAGCLISPITQTRYDMGAPLAIKGFTVAILGGLGSSTAAVAAGLLLGLLEAAAVSQFPMAYQDVVSIVILLLILVLRPSGLFVPRQTAALRAS